MTSSQHRSCVYWSLHRKGSSHENKRGRVWSFCLDVNNDIFGMNVWNINFWRLGSAWVGFEFNHRKGSDWLICIEPFDGRWGFFGIFLKLLKTPKKLTKTLNLVKNFLNISYMGLKIDVWSHFKAIKINFEMLLTKCTVFSSKKLKKWPNKFSQSNDSLQS